MMFGIVERTQVEVVQTCQDCVFDKIQFSCFVQSESLDEQIVKCDQPSTTLNAPVAEIV